MKRAAVPEPVGLAAVDPGDPQSWNRYSYVSNVPLGETDRLGCFGCPPGSHAATAADAERYIAVAESYKGHELEHASSGHYGYDAVKHHGEIDCSGLTMCALAGQRFTDPLTRVKEYLGMNLYTGNIREWTVPGTGARGDLILFYPKPKHVAIVTTAPDSQGRGEMFGSQSLHGPGYEAFGPGSWWATHASAPAFFRPCVSNPTPSHPSSRSAAHGTAGGGGAESAGPAGGGPVIGGRLFGSYDDWFASLPALIEKVTSTIIYPPIAN